MINIINIQNDYSRNLTKVTLELLENLGTIERVKEKLIITLPKMVSDMQEIETLVDEELTKNNLNPISFKE